jgi:signal transduction histidine kinase
LIQAEKMDAIGRMASGIAHEVKNPLGVILQGVNCLEMRLPPAQKDTFDILQKIKNNVERADNIIKGLLDFSKLTQLAMEAEDIAEVIESALGLVYHRVKMEGVEIVKKFDKDLPKVLVDRRKMEQVFVNVFLNAIQSMPKGGKLTVRSYKAELEEKSVAVTKGKNACFIRGQEAVIAEIEDTGKGISKENLGRVYEPFFTTKEPQEGTGLGLSVTMNIIEMHKGCIDIKSKINKGTKVTIFLKAAQGGK